LHRDHREKLMGFSLTINPPEMEEEPPPELVGDEPEPDPEPTGGGGKPHLI
jgi:hypothetical protein